MMESILLPAARAETDALVRAVASLRAEPDGPERLAEQLDLLAPRCLAYPAETKRLWDWFERQEPCMETDELSVICEDHLGLIDGRFRVVREAHALAAVRQSPHEAALAAALADLTAQRNRIAALLERINAPMPPSNEPEWTSADCRAAFERGEYETVESIITRLQAGGPVSKDDAE